MKSPTLQQKSIRDILKVFASNLMTLLSGVLVGLLLPKIVSKIDYGYYKTFTLYATYVGLFHFGIEDGIYLVYGGKSYEELDKSSFRFYSRFLLALEFGIAVVIAGISAFFLEGETRFIFICVAVYLFSYNIINYYRFISQITCRFNEYSILDIIRSALMIGSIALLWGLHRSMPTVGYRLFSLLYVGIFVVLMLWYLFAYRDITFGHAIGFREGKQNLLTFLKVGCPLMIANLSSTLILSIDRQFVNVLFDTETYALYAFAYNMLSLVTTMTSAVSTVLYPALKRTDTETLKERYGGLISVLSVVIFICIGIYFPLYWFVSWFLPQYVGSLVIFRIVLPGLAISAPITIVMHNYYKAMGVNFRFFVKSAIVLGLSALANLIAYRLFQSTLAISVASILTMLIWYVLIEHYFIKSFHTPWKRNFSYLLCMLAVFYAVTCIPSVYIGFAVYVVAVAAVTSLFFFREIRAWFAAKRAGKAE